MTFSKTRLRACASVSLLSLLLSPFIPANAVQSVASPSEVSHIQGAYEDQVVLPHEYNASSVVTNPDSETSASYTNDDVTVSVPSDPSKPVTLDSEDYSIGIHIPESSVQQVSKGDQKSGTVFSMPSDPYSTEVIIKEDASVQMVTSIENSSAPSEYTYNLDLPDGAYLQKTGETIQIMDSQGNILGGVAAPWAFDAEGKSVDTYFSIDGTTITQYVSHNSSNVKYPVIADPYLGINLLSSARWERRAEGSTLVVTPTAWGRSNGHSSLAILTDAYGSELCSRFGECRQQMKWQLLCHAQFAPVKSTWNLDSWRYRPSYALYIWHGCN